jgi:hypothetical protein
LGLGILDWEDTSGGTTLTLPSDLVVRPRIRIYDLFLQSPSAALEFVLNEADATLWKYKTMSCGLLGTGGSTSYSSYKQISRKSLIGRSFIIEFWDGALALFWTDVLYNEDWKDAMKNGVTVPNVNNLRAKDRIYKFEVHNYQCPSFT